MDLNQFKQKETAFIVAIIIIFALFGLWLRLLPMGQLTSGLVPQVIFTDSYYNIRLIEVIIHNFPSFPWFDPMTAFPFGKENDWGPFYPMLSACIAILLGAKTPGQIMNVASWIPPILSLVMIPILYWIGKTVADKKTGFIASCLISVIAGEYLYRSFFGYTDHHLEEVILSTAFILFYLLILTQIYYKHEEPFKKTLVLKYSVLAGLIYYLGMMNIPTIILFAGIIGLFCGLHAILTRDEQSLKTLAMSHGVMFGIFIILFGLTGIHKQGMVLSQYTPAHIVVALLLILEPVFLAVIIHYTKNRPAWQTGIAIIGIPAALFAVASIITPSVTSKIIDGFTEFFFSSYNATLISEMQMWDLTRAFHSFNIALLVMVVGLIVFGYQIFRKYEAVKFCALIWALVIIVSTILHLRYEYYIAVIVALFSSIALAWLYDILSVKQTRNVRITTEKKEKLPQQNSIHRYVPIIVVGLIILIITALSAQITWEVATKQLKIVSVDDDWAASLGWLEKNSPDPGIDYLKIYDKNGFSYPNSSYGVLSWWDYGHWITYYAKRLPVTNPFQDNVQTAAKFLLTPSEKSADRLANQTRSRYLILDYEMINSKYPSMLLFAYGQNAREKYQKYYFQQSEKDSSRYDPVLTLMPDFYRSLVTRLYIFDGSATNSTGASLIKYAPIQANGQQVPAISSVVSLTPKEANAAAKQNLSPGTDLVSIQYTHPITDLPAFTHYRLVYESPTVIAADENAQMHSVKIFEVVPGYQIKGNGTIELHLITNQEREFTYRQQSVNGTFTVPYATAKNQSGVRATGPYRNTDTGETFEVTEDEVLHGV